MIHIRIFLDIFSALSAIATIVFIFVPVGIDVKWKVIIVLSIAISIISLYLIETIFAKKSIEKQLNDMSQKNKEIERQFDDISQKHKAICKQFDEKENSLTIFRDLFYRLYIAVNIAEEKIKGKRYDMVFNLINNTFSEIKLMEEDNNDKQK